MIYSFKIAGNSIKLHLYIDLWVQSCVMFCTIELLSLGAKKEKCTNPEGTCGIQRSAFMRRNAYVSTRRWVWFLNFGSPPIWRDIKGSCRRGWRKTFAPLKDLQPWSIMIICHPSEHVCMQYVLHSQWSSTVYQRVNKPSAGWWWSWLHLYPTLLLRGLHGSFFLFIVTTTLGWETIIATWSPSKPVVLNLLVLMSHQILY